MLTPQAGTINGGGFSNSHGIPNNFHGIDFSFACAISPSAVGKYSKQELQFISLNNFELVKLLEVRLKEVHSKVVFARARRLEKEEVLSDEVKEYAFLDI